jgi:hypothetical protein
MSHPFKKEADKSRSAKMKKYADGGGIDEDIDVRSEAEKPTSVGPVGLGRYMEWQRSVNEGNEVDAGKRFYDTGTRIPGRQKAKNDAYREKLKGR